MMMKRASATLAVCTLAAGVAVISLGRSPAATTTEAAANAPTEAEASEVAATPADEDQPLVTIEGFAFGGTTVAKPGTSIEITNLDGAPHTMTARDGSFDSGTIEGGESGSLTLPTEPGTYEFFCSIHPSMVSSITVEA